MNLNGSYDRVEEISRSLSAFKHVIQCIVIKDILESKYTESEEKEKLKFLQEGHTPFNDLVLLGKLSATFCHKSMTGKLFWVEGSNHLKFAINGDTYSIEIFQQTIKLLLKEVCS